MILTILEVVLPVFLVIGAGYVATRSGLFSAGAVDGLMVFTQSFAIPCLLFVAIMQLDLGEAPALVFRNSAHGEANVVYRREDGNIGWIDPSDKA